MVHSSVRSPCPGQSAGGAEPLPGPERGGPTWSSLLHASPAPAKFVFNGFFFLVLENEKRDGNMILLLFFTLFIASDRASPLFSPGFKPPSSVFHPLLFMT